VQDTDTDLQAGPELVRNLMRPGGSTAPPTAREMRNFKTLHTSEWALTREEQLKRVLPNPRDRRQQFVHRRRFAWVAEAIDAAKAQAAAKSLKGGDLSAAEFFGGSQGQFWHYHPIVFIAHIGRLVRRESVEIAEVTQARMAQINCLMDQDGFLRDFVRFDNTRRKYVATAATTAPIQPYDIPAAGHYRFTQRQLACQGSGVHILREAVPSGTRVAILLLNLAEDIRSHLNLALTIKLSHVCSNHEQAALCLMASARHIQEHSAGLSVDLVLGAPNVADSAKLVTSAEFVRDRYQTETDAVCGNPAYGDVPLGVQKVELDHGPLPTTAADARKFGIHLALRP
jgi:hypothetical protein